jgi:hypothetical protein
MSRQVIDLCEDSDDDDNDNDKGEWPNIASIPSLPLSRKRRRDEEELSNDAHSRNESGLGNKTATGSAKFVVDLELADEVEVSVLDGSPSELAAKPSHTKSDKISIYVSLCIGEHEHVS